MFSEKVIDKRAAKAFIRVFGVPLPTITWILSFSDFCKMLDGTANSSPGPDGIPFMCWKRAPEEFKTIIYEAYLALLNGADVPHNFNTAFMIFLAKGSSPSDAEVVSRRPRDTSPLSLSNTDAKIMADGIRAAAQPTVTKWQCRAQQGGVVPSGWCPGRNVRPSAYLLLALIEA